MNWLEKSKNLLRAACTPWGIKASLDEKDNYSAIFTRDAVMAGIAGIFLEDETIIKGLENTLNSLKKLQGTQGQITSNFRVNKEKISSISFGTLSPKLDSCSWYLIGVGLMIKEGYIAKEPFLESVTKTINLLEGIEYNGKNLMYVPKGGNWADEYIYEGYILYDQALRVWALALLSKIYAKPEWYEKALAIRKTIKQAYKNEQKKYYNASFSPGAVFSQFDLAAHAILGIIFSKNNDFFNDSLAWISNNFLEEHKLPIAFYPIINSNDPEWEALSKYYLFRFKNMPHHFHNGGIWWIWLGWLSVTLSLWEKEENLNILVDLAFKFLENNEEVFQFHEYVTSDTLEVNGTKNLVYTATGICFLSLAKSGFDFSALNPLETQTIIEPHTIREEYFDLSNDLISIMKKTSLLDKEKLVIGIAGESGSGKSVTAKCLQAALKKLNINSAIIHQDGYYKLPPKENHIKRKEDINWVGVNELKLSLMQEHLNQFKNNEAIIDFAIVNYKTNKLTTNSAFLNDKTVLIVEGVYAFFLENIDFKVFMSRTYKDTLAKRKSRSREQYDPFVERVLEIEHNIVAKQKQLANAIVTKAYGVEEVLKPII